MRATTAFKRLMDLSAVTVTEVDLRPARGGRHCEELRRAYVQIRTRFSHGSLTTILKSQNCELVRSVESAPSDHSQPVHRRSIISAG